jgi:xylulokinase
LAGGSALAWFASAVTSPGHSSEIDDLLRDAGEAPAGSDGVVFLPYLVGKGSPRPDPDASATFLGLRPRHRRPHLTRAVLEGVAFGIKDIAQAFDSLNLRVNRLFITGGGAASSLWRGIVADVLGFPAGYTHGDSNLGSAIVLAVGLELEPNIEAAVRRLVSSPDPTPTTRENLPAYEAAYETFKAVVAKLTG